MGKNRGVMRLWAVVLLAGAAASPLALAQEKEPSKEGLEAMGVESKDDGAPKVEPAKQEPKAEPAPVAAPVAVSEGQAIMERARERMKRAVYVEFDVHLQGQGAMAGYTSEANAHVRVKRANANATNPWLVHVKGATTATPPMSFELAMLPNSREWVNHEDKTVHETIKMAPGGKSLTTPSGMWPTDVFDRVPYARVFRNATFTQEPGQEIGGVECDVVVVESKPGRGAASKGRWYIGHEDNLPRRFERIVPYEGQESLIVMELTNIRAEDQVPGDVTDELMRVEVPAGYAEKREKPKAPPAPAPTPTAPTTPAGSAMTPGDMTPGDVGQGNVAPTAQAEPVRPAPPAMAPEFELAKLDGSKVTLASMRGSVVVIDFFGTWTMASAGWHPKLKAALASHGDSVKLVPVAIRQRQPERAAEMLTSAGITESLLIGTNELATAYGVQVYPAAAVVGADGTLVRVVQGCGSVESEASLGEAITLALASKGAAPATPAGGADGTGGPSAGGDQAGSTSAAAVDAPKGEVEKKEEPSK